MRHFIRLALAALVLAAPASAFASGGNYSFDGGTQPEQTQVTAALNASSFPWSVAPGLVVVHIVRGMDSHALPGQIWLDANLLDSGAFSWGVVQHEYAHVVDFAVLTDAMRLQLHVLLQGTAWWGASEHAGLDSERFADLVSWAYWTSPDNVMRPLSAQDEGGQVAPAVFRAELASLLPGMPLDAQPVRVTASVKPRCTPHAATASARALRCPRP
ncbi:MAG TPA: hypothetical protein VGN27_05200 [Gaiellaceae bacterium]|jgi:hypothetical protein|nr:hypothetical protein [Gaiellaceae bacterium]